MTCLLTLVNKPFVVIRSFTAVNKHNNNLLKVNLSNNMSITRNKSDAFASDRFGKRLLDKVAVVTASTEG